MKKRIINLTKKQVINFFKLKAIDFAIEEEKKKYKYFNIKENYRISFKEKNSNSYEYYCNKCRHFFDDETIDSYDLENCPKCNSIDFKETYIDNILYSTSEECEEYINKNMNSKIFEVSSIHCLIMNK